jgi:hypothetical protein
LLRAEESRDENGRKEEETRRIGGILSNKVVASILGANCHSFGQRESQK